MSTARKNLSSFDASELPSGEGMRIGIVVSDWNSDITNALLEGCRQTLLSQGVLSDDILIRSVPGSFELPYGAQLFAEHSDVDAVICLGCVIQGETRHFDFVAEGVTRGISRVSLDYHLPVIFGVLTTANLEQAQDRAGGKHGNKGTEAAVAAIRMIALQWLMEESSNVEVDD